MDELHLQPRMIDNYPSTGPLLLCTNVDQN